MNTSDPRENFLTAMKNGKVGVFRQQSNRQQLESLLSHLKDFQSEGDFLYLDGLELLFDEKTDKLWRVRMLFYPEPLKRSWSKALQIPWADWLEGRTYDEVKAALQEKGLAFRAIRYTDNSLGLLVVKLPATIHLLFSESGEIDSLRLDFGHSHNVLTLMQSVESFNL